MNFRIFIIVCLLTLKCYAAESFCDKNTSQVECLESYIKNSTKRQVSIPKGSYYLSRGLELPSNIILNGNGATFIPLFADFYSAAIILKNVKNIKLKNINIAGNGYFNTTYNESKIKGSSKYCGFNLLTSGVLLVNSENIEISKLKISGVYNGIVVSGVDKNKLSNQVALRSNTIQNVGRSGITAVFAKNLLIADNKVMNVSGNHTECVKGWLSNAKFADGIYLDSVRDITVRNNFIDNVKRIGIVVEGRLDESEQIVLTNQNIEIDNNFIQNVNDCRGTENNAGVWVEPWKPESGNETKTKNVSIHDNQIINQGATPCSLFQYGILSGATNSTITNNKITYFVNDHKYRGIAIRCAYGNCIIANNYLLANTIGLLLNDNVRQIHYFLESNTFSKGQKSIVHVH